MLRTRTYGWYVLGLLACINFLNYGNRNVVFPMYDDLRASYGFSNSELGLLGTVFMLSHALVTVPVGWLADRVDRRRVIAIGVLVWSAAALASAAAQGLGTMLLSRALCGIGTAACVPVANALLCDVFPAEEKARTVSIFNVGLFIGGAAGFGFGAWFGFPMGFIVMALPGLLLVPLIWRLDVPARRDTELPKISWRAFGRDAVSILEVRTLRWTVLGAVLMAFAAGGYLAWFADFITAYKGLSIEVATLVFGGSALTGGLAGVITGGIVGDFLYRRYPWGRLAAMSLGFLFAVPCALGAIFVDGGPLFYASSWLLMFFITWYHGPMAAVVDDLVTDERANTGQASFIFLMHFVGTAPSSYVVGAMADGVGLRLAMLAPTVAVLLAAPAMMGGWRTVADDCAAAHAGGSGQTAL